MGYQPARPRKMTPTNMPFGEWLIKRAREYAEEARPSKRQIDKIAHLAGLVYAGKHRVAYVGNQDWYYEIPNSNHYTTLFHPENFYRFLIRSNAKEYIKSAPSIRAKAAASADDNAVQAARVAEAVAGDFRRRFRQEWIRRIEYRRVQIDGNTIHFIDWDETAGDQLEVPIYEVKKVKAAPDAVECFDCGLDSEIDDDANVEMEGCPECGSHAISVTRVPEIETQAVAEVLKVPTGDYVFRSVPIYEVTVNASARDHYELTDVYWLRWRYIKDKAVAEDEFGCELQGGITSDDDSMAQRYQKDLEKQYGGPELDDMTGTGVYTNCAIITEEWFQPVAFAGYIAAREHEVVPGSGIFIKEGQSAAEVFKSGVRLFHHAGQPLRIEPKVIRQHFHINGYDPNPNSFWYSGCDDAVSLQFDLNEVSAFIKTHTMSTAMAVTVARGRYVKNFGTDSAAAQVVTTGDNFPDEMGLDQVLWNLQPPPMAPSAYEQRNAIKEAMQLATGALNNFNGVDSARERTATQTSILEAQALAHSEEVIGGLAAGEGRLSRLATALWREHADVPRAFEIDGEATEADTEQFTKTDLVVDIDFVVEPGTILPRRPYQERADFEEFMKLRAEHAKTGEPMPTSMKRYMANVYGLSSLLVDSRKAETIARIHMKQLRELIPMMPQIVMEVAPQMMAAAVGALPPGVDPMMAEQYAAMAGEEIQKKIGTLEGRAEMLLEWIRVTPTAPAKVIIEAHLHEDMHGVIKDFINSEKGAQESPEYLAVLAARMREHVAAMGKYQADFTRAQIEAQAPAMQQQALLAQQANASGPDEDESPSGGHDSTKERARGGGSGEGRPAPHEHRNASKAARRETATAAPSRNA